MKNLLYLILIVMSTIIVADGFDSDLPNTVTKNKSLVEVNTELTKKVDMNKVISVIETEVSKFYKLLPEISGIIVSLPKAGTIGLKFDKDEIKIHQGIKLVAKRTGIDTEYTGNGILYLKYNKYNKLVGKYTRSQVGKFEIGDKINSKWYKPTVLIGSIKTQSNENQDLSISTKNNLLNNRVFFKNNKKTNSIITKISTIAQTKEEVKKQMKILFGLGIDYIVNSKVIKGKNNILVISIISTYTSNVIFNTKVQLEL